MIERVFKIGFSLAARNSKNKTIFSIAGKDRVNIFKVKRYPPNIISYWS